MSCVIVLGCYRSGTSAVAGVLHHLGVVMGKQFDEPTPLNPKGYYEDREFKRLFSMLNDGQSVDGLMNVLIRIREKEFSLWGVKDPQLCKLLYKFVPLLRTEHRVISTSRSKEDVCDSLNRAVAGETPERFLPLVEHYLEHKAKNLAVYAGPILEVEFNKLRSDPVVEVERIAAFVNLPIKQEAVDFISFK